MFLTFFVNRLEYLHHLAKGGINFLEPIQRLMRYESHKRHNEHHLKEIELLSFETPTRQKKP